MYLWLLCWNHSFCMLGFHTFSKTFTSPSFGKRSSFLRWNVFFFGDTLTKFFFTWAVLDAWGCVFHGWRFIVAIWTGRRLYYTKHILQCIATRPLRWECHRVCSKSHSYCVCIQCSWCDAQFIYCGLRWCPSRIRNTFLWFWWTMCCRLCFGEMTISISYQIVSGLHWSQWRKFCRANATSGGYIYDSNIRVGHACTLGNFPMLKRPRKLWKKQWRKSHAAYNCAPF